MSTAKPGSQDAPAGKRIQLQLLYLKDLSVEAPHVPGILFGHPVPDLKYSVETKHKMRDKDLYDVQLEISVHATGGDKTLFLIELKQGGLFEVTGYTSEDTATILRTRAPEALYPYARELVSSLASRAGFPRLQLRTIDFEKQYAESLKEREQP